MYGIEAAHIQGKLARSRLSCTGVKPHMVALQGRVDQRGLLDQGWTRDHAGPGRARNREACVGRGCLAQDGCLSQGEKGVL